MRTERALVVELMRTMPDPQLRALVLAFYQPMSCPELADAIGTTESGVIARLHHAVTTLRNRLDQTAPESPSAANTSGPDETTASPA